MFSVLFRNHRYTSLIVLFFPLLFFYSRWRTLFPPNRNDCCLSFDILVSIMLPYFITWPRMFSLGMYNNLISRSKGGKTLINPLPPSKWGKCHENGVEESLWIGFKTLALFKEIVSVSCKLHLILLAYKKTRDTCSKLDCFVDDRPTFVGVYLFIRPCHETFAPVKHVRAKLVIRNF